MKTVVTVENQLPEDDTIPITQLNFGEYGVVTHNEECNDDVGHLVIPCNNYYLDLCDGNFWGIEYATECKIRVRRIAELKLSYTLSK